MSNAAFIVTGGASGIGLAIAHKLAQEGHHPFVIGRDLSKLKRTGYAFVAADLTHAEQSSKALTTLRTWLNKESLEIKGLVNNAGVFDRLDFLASSDALWSRQFENNLLSAVRLTRELAPDLEQSRPSSVLNISSTLGLRPIALTTAYSAIKAAVINWTHALALEWAPRGIRVNCICPGIVDTPIHAFADMKPRAKPPIRCNP
ncbi:unnamed protein product [Sphagnum balticum]